MSSWVNKRKRGLIPRRKSYDSSPKNNYPSKNLIKQQQKEVNSRGQKQSDENSEDDVSKRRLKYKSVSRRLDFRGTVDYQSHREEDKKTENLPTQ